MLSNSHRLLRQATTGLRHELRYPRFRRHFWAKTTAQQDSSSQALTEPACTTDDTTTSSTSISDGTPTTTAVPPLSDITLAEFKTDTSTTLWDDQMALVNQPGVCNLGQGHPDYAGSRLAREAAAAAMVEPTMSAINQYGPMMGLESLQGAICKFYNKHYDLHGGGGGKRVITPENVMVTIGATGGLNASLQAFVDPGDEVLVFNPGYPWYSNLARVMGATPVLVELHGPSFAPDMEEIEKAITPKTRVLIINSPHNPCGHCYTKKELEGIARLALKYNLFIISDEVYENVTFGGIKHLRMADEEGMFERTVTLGSSSKLYGLTGWRVGWALSTPELLKGMGVHHSNTSFCSPSPLQHGLSVALEAEDGSFEGVPEMIEGNALLLGDALREKGFAVAHPQGGPFLMADSTPLGLKGLECTNLLLKHAKVGAIPGITFCTPDPKDSDGSKDIDRPLIRFAICKRRETVEEAVRRIRAMEFPPKP